MNAHIKLDAWVINGMLAESFCDIISCIDGAVHDKSSNAVETAYDLGVGWGCRKGGIANALGAKGFKAEMVDYDVVQGMQINHVTLGI